MIDVQKLPVEQAVAKLLAYAIMLPASDIFFAADESNVVVSVRHLGIVNPIAIVPWKLGRRFVSHVKALAGMDLAEKRLPAGWPLALLRRSGPRRRSAREHGADDASAKTWPCGSSAATPGSTKSRNWGWSRSQFDELVRHARHARRPDPFHRPHRLGKNGDALLGPDAAQRRAAENQHH